jgi:hypothetical protein
MTVCCRSNDMLWGAYGANVVHFSILQEVIAIELGVGIGVYRQVSNNFHLYTDNQTVKQLLASPPYSAFDYYAEGLTRSLNFMQPNEFLSEVLRDCEDFCNEKPIRTWFLSNVAAPLRDNYLLRKAGLPWGTMGIPDCDWKRAFEEWVKRR